MRRSPSDSFIIKMHNTDILEVFPDDSFKVTVNGWFTNTTMQRLREYGRLSIWNHASRRSVKVAILSKFISTSGESELIPSPLDGLPPIRIAGSVFHDGIHLSAGFRLIGKQHPIEARVLDPDLDRQVSQMMKAFNSMKRISAALEDANSRRIRVSGMYPSNSLIEKLSKGIELEYMDVLDTSPDNVRSALRQRVGAYKTMQFNWDTREWTEGKR
jgi:hypothetical protein